MSLAIVQQVRAHYPTPLGDQHAAFLIDVARSLGARLFRKDAGSNILLPPPYNVHVSQDIVILYPQWIDILQDAEGQAIPMWDVHDGATGEFVDVSPIAVPPVDTPPDEPMPDPIIDLINLMAAMLARLDAIERQLAAPPPVPLVQFPDYQGRFFGQPFTLKPVK